MWVVGIVVLLLVAAWAVRSMRPKPPAPLDATGAVSRGSAPPHSAPSRRATVSPEALDAASVAEIDRLVAAGSAIAAIKVFRDRTGVSLQEAKDAIDRWRPGATTPPAIPHPGPGAFSAASLPSDIRAEIDRLVAAEQPISAIKLLREHARLSLKDAKDAIDAWAPEP